MGALQHRNWKCERGETSGSATTGVVGTGERGPWFSLWAAQIFEGKLGGPDEFENKLPLGKPSPPFHIIPELKL